jgi:hypothetical protein
VLGFPFRSVFDGPHSDDTPSVCPIPGCRYYFDPELEDVAVERHARGHTPEQWAAIVAAVTARRDDVVAATEEVVAGFDADLARLRRWSGAGE